MNHRAPHLAAYGRSRMLAAWETTTRAGDIARNDAARALPADARSRHRRGRGRAAGGRRARQSLPGLRRVPRRERGLRRARQHEHLDPRAAHPALRVARAARATRHLRNDAARAATPSARRRRSREPARTPGESGQIDLDRTVGDRAFWTIASRVVTADRAGPVCAMEWISSRHCSRSCDGPWRSRHGRRAAACSSAKGTASSTERSRVRRARSAGVSLSTEACLASESGPRAPRAAPEAVRGMCVVGAHAWYEAHLPSRSRRRGPWPPTRGCWSRPSSSGERRQATSPWSRRPSSLRRASAARRSRCSWTPPGPRWSGTGSMTRRRGWHRRSACSSRC